jgi:ferredoxin
MNIMPYAMKNSPECIRFGACRKICPKGAIVSEFQTDTAAGQTQYD